MSARTEHMDLLDQVESDQATRDEVRRVLGTLTGAELDAHNTERLNDVRVAIGSRFTQQVPRYERYGLAGEYAALHQFPGANMGRLQDALLRKRVIQTRPSLWRRLLRLLRIAP